MPCIIEITRMETSKAGAFGILSINKEIFCNTLELPWKMNHEDISCIPVGTYEYEQYLSEKYGYDCIKIKNVYNRTVVRMHRGNYLRDTTGCILPGLYTGRIKMERVVLGSKVALDKIITGTDIFGKIIIRECY